MKILMTGSSGFIGSHLKPYLKDHEIYHLESDLRHHGLVRTEVRDIQPEMVIHLGARTEVEQSFYEQITFSEINYVGSVNLIEISKEVPNFKNFVFASTMEVYGPQPKHTVCDHLTTPYPNAPYAVAKYAVEKYLEYAGRSYNLPYTIIRQTNCYGRKDNDFFVTEQIITQMLKNPDEIHLGYAEPYRNFIYIDDMLDAWTAIINNPEKCKEKIFTLGPDNPIKIKDYVDIIAKKIGWDGKVYWDTKPERPGEIYWLNSSGQLLEDTLGWRPKVTLSEGLDRTISWWRNVNKR